MYLHLANSLPGCCSRRLRVWPPCAMSYCAPLDKLFSSLAWTNCKLTCFQVACELAFSFIQTFVLLWWKHSVSSNQIKRMWKTTMLLRWAYPLACLQCPASPTSVQPSNWFQGFKQSVSVIKPQSLAWTIKGRPLTPDPDLLHVHVNDRKRDEALNKRDWGWLLLPGHCS